MHRTLGDRLGKSTAIQDPLGHRHVAKMRDRLAAENASEILRRLLARLTTRRIRAVNKRMLGIGLDHHERNLRTHRDVLEIAAAEIALDERALGTVNRRGLVEKSARTTGEDVLGLLAELRHRRLVLRDTVDLRKRQPRGDLKRGGRAQARAKRNVAAEHGLETGLDTSKIAVKEEVEGAEHITRPGSAFLHRRDLRNDGLILLTEIESEKLDLVIGIRSDREERALVNRRGEDEALVVVGVVAEHLDAPRRIRNRRRLRTVKLRELRNNLIVNFLIDHKYLLIKLKSRTRPQTRTRTQPSAFFAGFERTSA